MTKYQMTVYSPSGKKRAAKSFSNGEFFVLYNSIHGELLCRFIENDGLYVHALVSMPDASVAEFLIRPKKKVQPVTVEKMCDVPDECGMVSMIESGKVDSRMGKG